MKKFSALWLAITLIIMVFASSAFADTYVYANDKAEVGILTISGDTLTVGTADTTGISKANLGNRVSVFANSQDFSTAWLGGKSEIVKIKASGDLVVTIDGTTTAAEIGEISSFIQSGDYAAAVGATGLFVSPDAEFELYKAFTSKDSTLKVAVALPSTYKIAAGEHLTDLATSVPTWGILAGNAYSEEINKFLTALNGKAAWTANSVVNINLAVERLFAKAAATAGSTGAALALNSKGEVSFLASDNTINGTYSTFTDMDKLGSKVYVASKNGVKSDFGTEAMIAGLKEAYGVQSGIVELVTSLKNYKDFIDKEVATGIATQASLTTLKTSYEALEDFDTSTLNNYDDDTHGAKLDAAKSLVASIVNSGLTAAEPTDSNATISNMLLLGVLTSDATFKKSLMNAALSDATIQGLVDAVNTAVTGITGLAADATADAITTALEAVPTAVNDLGDGLAPDVKTAAIFDAADDDTVKAVLDYATSLANNKALTARATTAQINELTAAVDALKTAVNDQNVEALNDAITALVTTVEDSVNTGLLSQLSLLSSAADAFKLAITSAADTATLASALETLAKSSTLTGQDALQQLKDLASALKAEVFATGDVKAIAADEANKKIYAYTGDKVYVIPTDTKVSADITGDVSLSFSENNVSVDMVASGNYVSFIDDNGLTVYKVADNKITLVNTYDGIVSLARMNATLTDGTEPAPAPTPSEPVSSVVDINALGTVGDTIAQTMGTDKANFLTSKDVVSKDAPATVSDAVKNAINASSLMGGEDAASITPVVTLTLSKEGFILREASYDASKYVVFFINETLLAAAEDGMNEGTLMNASGEAITEGTSKYAAAGSLDAGTYTMYAAEKAAEEGGSSNKSAGSSSGGCNAGFAGLAALAVLALIKKSK